MSIIRYSIVLIALCAISACSDAPGETPNAASKAATPSPVATSVKSKVVDPLARGATLYKRCQACHTLEEDGRNKVGPNLWAIMGKQAGQNAEFNYSKVMAASEIVWTQETLSAYLENPRTYMPGNRMSFAGLRKPEDRKAVIAYIEHKTSAN